MLWQRYHVERSALQRLRRRMPFPRLPLRQKLADANAQLEEKRLETDCNEVYLLHGTRPETLLQVSGVVAKGASLTRSPSWSCVPIPPHKMNFPPHKTHCPPHTRDCPPPQTDRDPWHQRALLGRSLRLWVLFRRGGGQGQPIHVLRQGSVSSSSFDRPLLSLTALIPFT